MHRFLSKIIEDGLYGLCLGLCWTYPIFSILCVIFSQIIIYNVIYVHEFYLSKKYKITYHNSIKTKTK